MAGIAATIFVLEFYPIRSTIQDEVRQRGLHAAGLAQGDAAINVSIGAVRAGEGAGP